MTNAYNFLLYLVPSSSNSRNCASHPVHLAAESLQSSPDAETRTIRTEVYVCTRVHVQSVLNCKVFGHIASQ